jgi:ribosomal protein S6--L-glutamate ligase
MNIGIITVRDHEYHPNRRLIEAAAEQGHRAMLIHPYRVWPCLDKGKPFLLGPPEIKQVDVILPRQGATVGDSCLALIRQFSLMGIPVVNDLNSIRLAKNQFLTLMALSETGINVPDTVFVNSAQGFKDALVRLGGFPVVVKQASNRQGQGVALIESEHSVHGVIHDDLDEREGLLVQRFIHPKGRQDIRVLVIGGKIAGAIELWPKEGDFRANIHLGGKSQPKDLPHELEDIALKATGAIGLDIAGVDLILDQNGQISVIELNYSPGFRGMEAATGIDIAGRIVHYLTDTYGKRKV